jgi:hypothetical protein
MRDQIIKILRSQIQTAQIADDIASYVVNAEAVADAILALFPSPAVAAEPVAWTNEAQLQFLKDDPACANIPMAMWNKASPSSGIPLYAAPPVRGDREELRLLIVEACDLLAERKHGNPARSLGHNARLALEGALRLLPVQPGAGERIEEHLNRIHGALADYADLTPESDETWESWYAAAFDMASSKIKIQTDAIRALSRQAPHSSRETET